MILGFSAKKEKAEEKGLSLTKADIEKTTQTTATGVKEAETTGTQREEQVIQLLDDETQALLSGIIQELGGAFDATGGDFSAQLGGIADILTTRAGEAEGAIEEQTSAIIAEARQRAESELGQNITSLAQATGSSQNSLVALLAGQGRADLETQLAGLAAELNIQGRQLATGELESAAGVLQAGATAEGGEVGQIAALTELLRGATAVQTGVTETAQISKEQESFNQLIEELQKISSLTLTKGQTSGTSFGAKGEFG